MQIRPDSVDATGANVTIQPSITFKTVPNLLDRTATAANITGLSRPELRAVDVERLGDRLEEGRAAGGAVARAARGEPSAAVPLNSGPPLSPGSAHTVVRIRPETVPCA
jgi:hypothetical protein